MYGMIRPGQVSNSPMLRSMLKIGVTKRDLREHRDQQRDTDQQLACRGRPAGRRRTPPCHRSTTAITVVISPIPIELISAELNASPEKMPL